MEDVGNDDVEICIAEGEDEVLLAIKLRRISQIKKVLNPAKTDDIFWVFADRALRKFRDAVKNIVRAGTFCCKSDKPFGLINFNRFLNRFGIGAKIRHKNFKAAPFSKICEPH